MKKDLKWLVKDLITMQLTRKLGYFTDIQHFKIITRIMTDDIIPGYTRFPEISHSFRNIFNIYLHRHNIKEA